MERPRLVGEALAAASAFLLGSGVWHKRRYNILLFLERFAIDVQRIDRSIFVIA